jgi:TATA-box binding protein (TBP) (component of TFIID and TFIIIB)
VPGTPSNAPFAEHALTSAAAAAAAAKEPAESEASLDDLMTLLLADDYVAPSPSVTAKATSHDADMRRALCDVACAWSGKMVTDPYVTTMTVCVKTSFVLPPPAAHEEPGMEKKPDFFRAMHAIAVQCGGKIKTEKSFKSSVIMSVDGMSVKVFTNGTLHFTGAKSLASVSATAHSIAGAMRRCEPAYHGELLDIDVNMMNLCCKYRLDGLINMDAAYRRLEDREDDTVVLAYDKVKYNGMKIAFRLPSGARAKVAVFNTGCVLFSGNKSAAGFEATAKRVAEVFDVIRAECVSRVVIHKGASKGSAKRQKRVGGADDDIMSDIAKWI